MESSSAEELKENPEPISSSINENDSKTEDFSSSARTKDFSFSSKTKDFSSSGIGNEKVASENLENFQSSKDSEGKIA